MKNEIPPSTTIAPIAIATAPPPERPPPPVEVVEEGTRTGGVVGAL
jgi:hypothetical protein